MEELSMEQWPPDNVPMDIGGEEVSQPVESVDTPSEDAGSVQSTQEHVFEYPVLFKGKTLLELSSSSWSRSNKAKSDIQPYLRGCKWSPDGTCCLTVVNSDGMHLNELSRDLYAETPLSNRTIDILDTVVHVKESGLIYDFCWYPGMNSAVPETCCWITTKQNSPIQMWDAFDGSLRCSYRGFNALDEMEAAYSLTFSVDGSRIIAGYKKMIRTFDVDRPGREFAEHKITSPASCFATNNNLIAVGSWNTTINLYNINDMGGYKSIGKMHGHAGGVTHMKFTPEGLRLVSGARRDHRLLVWDIRYYRRPLNVLHRTVDTNQRVYFDISPCGKYLVSGGTDGILKVWNMDVVNWTSSLDATEDGSDNATYKFQLHNDCCNSVSVHPLRPILATGSGQYHMENPTLDDESEHKMTENGDSHVRNMDENSKVPQNTVDMRYSSECENSLVFWWIGDVQDST